MIKNLVQRRISWSEQDWLGVIVDLAIRLGYLVHHQRPALRKDGRYFDAIMGNPGFPDLVLAGHGRLIFWELKLKGNVRTPGQNAWADALRGALGHEYDILYLPPHPDDQVIDQLIARLR